MFLHWYTAWGLCLVRFPLICEDELLRMAQTVRVGAWGQCVWHQHRLQKTHSNLHHPEMTALFCCDDVQWRGLHIATSSWGWHIETNNHLGSHSHPRATECHQLYFHVSGLWDGTVWEETHTDTGERANSTMEGSDPVCRRNHHCQFITHSNKIWDKMLKQQGNNFNFQRERTHWEVY